METEKVKEVLKRFIMGDGTNIELECRTCGNKFQERYGFVGVIKCPRCGADKDIYQLICLRK